ncbi:hypothetical protein LJR235_004298 [Pararhizobium sp. LjRoot235]|uniref:hypothetical protein n=1 Tax=Pararhizobium sp. LjRoot235 TaxID=3342291 RepID=UPI003ECDA805
MPLLFAEGIESEVSDLDASNRANRRRLPPRRCQIGAQFESEDGAGFELLQHGHALGDNLLHQPPAFHVAHLLASSTHPHESHAVQPQEWCASIEPYGPRYGLALDVKESGTPQQRLERSCISVAISLIGDVSEALLRNTTQLPEERDFVIGAPTYQVPPNPHNHRFALAAYALRNQAELLARPDVLGSGNQIIRSTLMFARPVYRAQRDCSD